MTMNNKKYAVLIDGDNVSSEYMSTIQREIIRKYGDPTYKRVYGDWTSPRFKGWRETIAEYPIVPIQQFNNSKGKNSTDITLIIDAMDILYTGNVDGFCIVSNDGDFTKLATRLKEAGKEVIGMGLSNAQEHVQDSLILKWQRKIMKISLSWTMITIYHQELQKNLQNMNIFTMIV